MSAKFDATPTRYPAPSDLLLARGTKHTSLNVCASHCETRIDFLAAPVVEVTVGVHHSILEVGSMRYGSESSLIA
jgi:hypothetical protein